MNNLNIIYTERIATCIPYRPSRSSAILIIITYEKIIFLDNVKRDKHLLEVNYEELLNIMGKNDKLKMTLSINQSKLSETDRIRGGLIKRVLTKKIGQNV